MGGRWGVNKDLAGAREPGRGVERSDCKVISLPVLALALDCARARLWDGVTFQSFFPPWKKTKQKNLRTGM